MKQFNIFTLLFVVLSLSHSSFCNEGNYTLGVFPYIPPSRLQEPFNLVAEDLGKHLSKPVHFRSKSNMKKFNIALRKEKYDIAFVQPFDYVWAHDELGYLPLVRRQELLNIFIVTLADSPITTITDLKGKTIAFPPEASAVSQLVRNYLEKKDININQEVEIRYFHSHSSCLQKVQLRNVDACATAEAPINMFQNKMNIQFKKIAKASSIPPAIFIVHPRVPEEERAMIKQTMLNWPNTEEGHHLLKRLHFKTFIEANDEDYDEIRKFTKSKH